jgi:hypothetical protein
VSLVRALWIAALAAAVAGLVSAFTVVGREARWLDASLLFMSGAATGVIVVAAVGRWRRERRRAPHRTDAF